MRAIYVVSILIVSILSPANQRAVDFAVAKNCTAGTSPAAIVVGDFDGDGKVDIAVANTIACLIAVGTVTPRSSLRAQIPNSVSLITDLKIRAEAGDSNAQEYMINFLSQDTGAPGESWTMAQY